MKSLWLLTAVFGGTLLAQPAERPQFEVASVKLSPDQGPLSVRVLPGGRLTATAPLKLLIMNAYGFQRSQIVGGPAWIDDDRYVIDAKAAENASRPRLMLMLGSLLESRFQMKVHRESRETAVYNLVSDKNGPKLPASKQSECPTDSASASPPCGQIRIAGSAAGVRMEGDRVPISELIRVLAVALNQPVLDRTSLTGLFDVRLEFVNQPPGAPPSDSPLPTVFAAVQEQLGLRLESGKGPVDFLVIDHIERPSAN